MAKQLFAMPMRLLSVEAHPVIRVDLFNVLILSLAGQVGSVIAFVTTGRWKLQITHTQSVKNGSCQSGVWRKQWGTDTRVVTATATSCGQAAPPSNGDYSFAICPIGYNVTGGGSQLVNWNPANEI